MSVCTVHAIISTVDTCFVVGKFKNQEMYFLRLYLDSDEFLFIRLLVKYVILKTFDTLNSHTT